MLGLKVVKGASLGEPADWEDERSREAGPSRFVAWPAAALADRASTGHRDALGGRAGSTSGRAAPWQLGVRR